MTTRLWRASGSNRLAIALRLTACVAAIAILVLATGCGPAAGTPDEQLRAWVAAMEAAAENEARGDMMALIAEAYNDARGNSREDVDKLLRVYFLRQDRIALLTSIDEINVAGGTAASMQVTVGMAGTDNHSFGIRADALRFELELEAEGTPRSWEDWRLLSARWAELGGQPR